MLHACAPTVPGLRPARGVLLRLSLRRLPANTLRADESDPATTHLDECSSGIPQSLGMFCLFCGTARRVTCAKNQASPLNFLRSPFFMHLQSALSRKPRGPWLLSNSVHYIHRYVGVNVWEKEVQNSTRCGPSRPFCSVVAIAFSA